MKTLEGTYMEINALAMRWDIIKMVIISNGMDCFSISFYQVSLNCSTRQCPCYLWRELGLSLSSLPLLDCKTWYRSVCFWSCCNVSSHTLGYLTGTSFRLNERYCRTLVIEVAMHNGGLDSGLAKQMRKIATVGLVPAVSGSMMNITGIVLTRFLSNKPIWDAK